MKNDINNIIKKIEKYSKEIKEESILIRRELHKIPELGNDLPKTRKFILNELKKYNVKVYDKVGEAGIVAVLKGKGKGKTVAYRADMDALPIVEDTGCKYKSTHPGKMHACGHDSHVTIALSILKVFSLIKDEIKGTLKFIFQPAEETDGGAVKMIEDGALKNPDVDYIFASHVWPDIETGKIGLRSGGLMAGTDIFEVNIQGKGGHAGFPHYAINPLVVASKIVCELESIKNYYIEAGERIVLSVCIIEGGKVNNVIPNDAKITGTVRYFSEESQEKTIKQFHKIVNNIANIYGAICRINYKKHYIPVINSDDVISEINELMNKGDLGDKVFNVEKPSMGAEDFSYFLKKTKGAMFWLGTRNESKNLINNLHHPKFNIDEDILEPSVNIISKILLNFLNKPN